MLLKRRHITAVNVLCYFASIVFTFACCYFVSFNLAPRSADVKKILIWNAKELSHLKLFEAERECDFVCSYTTSEDKYLDASKYDGVIFGRNIFKDSRAPEKLSATQKYVFMSMEPPEGSRISEKFDDVFDIVATYRSDSDVVIPRFYLLDKYKRTLLSKIANVKSPLILDSFNGFFDSKIKFAAYVSFNKTDTFMDKIREFIEVDVYTYDIDVYSKLGNKYYFYFAYDDRVCVDYQTETVEEALFHDTIPIVRSGLNGFLPVGSYIGIEGFSAEGLAKRLIHIVKYREEYLKYFWWKSHYEVVKHVEGVRTPFCQLCKMVHEGFVNRRKFVEWWQGSSIDPVCKYFNVSDLVYESY